MPGVVDGKIPVSFRARAAAVRTAEKLGDPVAERFGEGARPSRTEIMLLLMSEALRDKDIQKRVVSRMIQSRMQPARSAG